MHDVQESTIATFARNKKSYESALDGYISEVVAIKDSLVISNPDVSTVYEKLLDLRKQYAETPDPGSSK